MLGEQLAEAQAQLAQQAVLTLEDARRRHRGVFAAGGTAVDYSEHRCATSPGRDGEKEDRSAALSAGGSPRRLHHSSSVMAEEQVSVRVGWQSHTALVGVGVVDTLLFFLVRNIILSGVDGEAHTCGLDVARVEIGWKVLSAFSGIPQKKIPKT